MRYFYSHLIEIDSLTFELDQMDLSDKEKKHLADLIDINLHNTILDAIFSELSEEDKKAVIEHLKDNKHSEVWSLLNERVEGIEDKIKAAAETVKKELHEDIKEAAKLHIKKAEGK